VVWLLVISLFVFPSEPKNSVDMEHLNAPQGVLKTTVFYPKGEQLLKMIRKRIRANAFKRTVLITIFFTTLFYFLFMAPDMVQGNVLAGSVFCGVSGAVCSEDITLQTAFIRVSKVFRGDDNHEKEFIVDFFRPQRIILKANQEEFEAEIVRLCQLRTPEGKKFITQAEIGQAFELSRQMINRRKRVVEQAGLSTLLLGEYEKSKLTEAVQQRIQDLIVSNWHINQTQIAAILVEEGLVNNISVATVRQGIQQMDGLKLVKRMRQILEKEKSAPNLSQNYLIDRLCELVKKLLHGKGDVYRQVEKVYQELNQIRKTYPEPPKGHYKWNQKHVRFHLARDRRRKQRQLEAMVNGENSQKTRSSIVCPDCGTDNVTKKEERERTYTDENGEKKIDVAIRMRCQNENCKTKTFTILPANLELWARVTIGVKRKALQLIFHVRSSYRRGADYLKQEELINCAWTTVLNWIRKAGQETIELERILKIRWSGKLVVDEKWIKLFKAWIYLFVACDAESGEVLHQEVFLTSDKDTAKTFLLQLKALGYNPDVIITDLCPNYEKPVADVFAGVPHHLCVFHAERAAKNLVNKYLPSEEDQANKNKLKKNIRDLFKTKTPESLTKCYLKLKNSQADYPHEAAPVFSMLERYYPILLQSYQNPNIPATSNAAEHAIKEFDIKYQNTFGYSSFYAIKDFVSAYTVYQRLNPIDSGPNKGKSPREVSQHGDIDLSWYDYLLVC
jgi:transposase-like protein